MPPSYFTLFFASIKLSMPCFPAQNSTCSIHPFFSFLYYIHQYFTFKPFVRNEGVRIICSGTPSSKKAFYKTFSILCVIF